MNTKEQKEITTTKEELFSASNLMFLSGLILFFFIVTFLSLPAKAETFHHGATLMRRDDSMKIWVVKDFNDAFWPCTERNVGEAVYLKDSHKEFVQCATTYTVNNNGEETVYIKDSGSFNQLDTEHQWVKVCDLAFGIGVDWRLRDEANKNELARVVKSLHMLIADIKGIYVSKFLTGSPSEDTEMFNNMPIEHHYKLKVKVKS